MAGWALRQWTVVPGARSHAKLLLFPVRDGGVHTSMYGESSYCDCIHILSTVQPCHLYPPSPPAQPVLHPTVTRGPTW